MLELVSGIRTEKLTGRDGGGPWWIVLRTVRSLDHRAAEAVIPDPRSTYS